MKTLTATLIAVALATGLLVAQGTLSVPFTADQQAGVQFSLDIVNADRAAQDPPLPPLVLEAYGIAMCQAIFTNYANQRAAAQEVLASVRDTYLGNHPDYAFQDADRAAVEAFMATCVANGGC